MESLSLRSRLEQAANDLRPSERCRRISVLGIAQQLNARVCVRFEKERQQGSALVDLASRPPIIYLIRRGTVQGKRYIEIHEESVLTPRERFSVAHELGHLIAFTKFQIRPAEKVSDYWVQEECMHNFAATLLAPDWLLDGWLDSIAVEALVPPFALRRWANVEAGLSEEVVATQLCKRRAGIGFVKVAATARKKDRAPVLRVLFSASARDLGLPKRHAHIADNQLIRALATGDVGRAHLRQSSLDQSRIQDLQVAWRRAGHIVGQGRTVNGDPVTESIPIFWVSFGLPVSTDPDGISGQLRLTFEDSDDSLSV